MRGGRLVVALEDPSRPRGARRDRVRRADQDRAGAGAQPACWPRPSPRPTSASAPTSAAARGDAAAADRIRRRRRRQAAGHAGAAAGAATAASATRPPIEQSDNSLVRLINTMIVEAQAQGVSDIHIEMPARARQGAHPLPQGRRAAALHGAAAHLPQRDDRAHQDHVRPRHLRAPQAAGRQDQLRQVRAAASGSSCAWPRSRPPTGSKTWCCACWPRPSRSRWTAWA